jgi:ESS family glutamate:Na+ symporter
MGIPFEFGSFLAFGSLAIMLLVGIFFRANVKFFQNYLIPSCLIGGVLGLVLENVGVIKFTGTEFEFFAYHFFNISFISVGLSRSDEPKEKAAKSKDYFRGALWMASVQCASFAMQAALSGGIVILFGLIGMKLFPTFGFLVPMGFEEGPGQALSFGKVWESMGFEHGATIGLTFAAIGFLFAFFVGVPLANWGIRKRYSSEGSAALPTEFLRGIFSPDQKKEPAGELTTHSSNIDTLAFHAALIGLVYVLTYFFTLYLGKLVGTFAPDVAKMLWGFFFFFGLTIAFVVRMAMRKVGVEYLINPGMQRRITGWSVDFLIVSTIMAIKVMVVWKYIVPIAVMSLVNGILTTALVIYFGKRLWEYNVERMVGIYGAVTGTVSSGLLLLRIADPEFKTPAAIEIGLMSLFMVPVVLGSGILVNAPLWWGWSVGMTVLVFVGIFVATLIFMKAAKLWLKPKF